MKKFLLLAGVACLLSANAQAGVSQYVSGKLSYDFNKVKAKSGGEGLDKVVHAKLNKVLVGSTHIAYGIRAGYVRGELELNNSRDIKRNHVYDNDGFGIEHFRLYKHSFMANAYFDYLTCTPWTPYVGAGIGVSYLKADTGDYAKSVYTLGWQVMGGITYDINSHWTLDLGYRYADLGRVRGHFGEDYVTKFAARDHEIMFGARYEF
ncbi:MAG: porin family protein [Alphaproteobacteria bacterium]|nr:porin family protein [Alphaproteobacteria bacterium]